LVRVAVAADDFDAQLMRDQLAAAGIRSMVQNMDALSASGFAGVGAPFSRAVYVLAGDAERAASVLAEPPASAADTGAER
jgi:hypothetical protein